MIEKYMNEETNMINQETDVNYPLLLTKAIRLATEHHGDVMNKDGTPYILHPLRLMMFGNGYEEQIVAILHDTIEDTPLTLEDLAADGFPEPILAALDALTKRAGEEYEAFIERIALNPLAVNVKLLDLTDNIDVTRLPVLDEWALKRTAKYHGAIQRLKQVQAQ